MTFTQDLVRGLSNEVIKRQSKGFGFVDTDLYYNRFRRRKSLIAQSNQSKSLPVWIFLNYIIKSNSYVTVNTVLFHYKEQQFNAA